MGVLKNGEWLEDSQYNDKEGKFVRQKSTFRNFISNDENSEYRPEQGRYHLYVSYACPWANRTIISRKLKGLEDTISMSVVSPHMGKNGWEFTKEFAGSTGDQINQAKYLWEIYVKSEPDCTGKVTVPVLWDKKTEKIVNNESKEIMRMFDTQFEEFATNKMNLYPDDLKEKIDKTIEEIYEPINNGVYKSGFATTQEQYEKAVKELFKNLEKWENVLSTQRYLCGDIITEADICMFTTLYRFDPVYYVHFKCNIMRIFDFPNLWNYLKDIYQYPGISETCNMEHVKQHYYWSHPFINPHRIVPVGPLIDYGTPHDRDRLSFF